MASGPKRAEPVSPSDYSEITWNDVFQLADIDVQQSEMAKRLVELLVVLVFTMFWTYMPHKLCFFFWISRILLFDDPPTILHDFMGGTHEEMIRFVCGSDMIFFEAVQSAVTILRTSVPTKRARVESNFPSPSDDEDVIDTGLTKELKKKVRVIYSMVYVLGLGMFIMT